MAVVSSEPVVVVVRSMMNGVLLRGAGEVGAVEDWLWLGPFSMANGPEVDGMGSEYVE